MAGGNRRAVYQIGITADTTEFQAALNKALQSLKALGENTNFTGRLQQASAAALDLASNLRRAINQDTGKLDLSILNENLTRSGKGLEYYKNQLLSLGPAGRNAFLQVAQAITKAETPLIRSNRLLTNLWITMKNTMRWQLTSRMLHGFIGAIHTAYGYAKDLNESLTSIRIVTNKSTEEMADFAAQANEAAKTLSTTTTGYTDASLIYYQQGLSDEEVQKRTETTIKLANVANEDAKTVSEELTAVWNNFYDGSKSLEYYADVMTKLGATTASSSAEIAKGIQKFASVTKTIGLSYEYAASALATLVAKTRETPEIVGNALKTLFSRIQGLRLGETLDDGTDLNKYSEALYAVGVNIKDTNGELKDMDTILDETSEKWSVLTQDQKMALAQTVAGVRQYTQFISLMDNWGDFQKNLNTALNSTGELESQAQIYSESWEAARKRVKAAAQDIYDSLINPEFYIDVDNVLTPLLSGIAKVIDTMGGAKGVLMTLGTLITSVYGDKIAQGLHSMAVTIGFMSGKEQERAIALQEQAAALSRATIYETHESEAAKMRVDAQRELISLQGESARYMSQLTARQQEILRADLEHVQNLYKQVQAYSEASESARALAETSRNNIFSDLLNSNQNGVNVLERIRDVGIEVNNVLDNLMNGGRNRILINTNDAERSINSLLNVLGQLSVQQRGIEVIQTKIQSLGGVTREAIPDLMNLAQKFGLLSERATMSAQDATSFFTALANGRGDAAQIRNAIDSIEGALNRLGIRANDTRIYTANMKDFKSNLEGTKVAADELKNSMYGVSKGMEDLNYKQMSASEVIVMTTNQFMRLGMTIQSVKSLVATFSDEDLSPWEKLSRTLISLGMIIPSLMSLKKIFNDTKIKVTRDIDIGSNVGSMNAHTVAVTRNTTAINNRTVAMQRNSAASNAQAASEQKNTNTITSNKLANDSNTISSSKNTTAKNTNTISKVSNTKATENDTLLIIDNTFATEMDIQTTEADTIVTNTNTATTQANSLATESDTLTIIDNTVATGANTLATENGSLMVEADTLATQANALANQNDTLTIIDNTLATEMDAFATENGAVATEADTLATQANIAVTEANTTANEASAIASTTYTTATEGSTVATTLNTTATGENTLTTNLYTTSVEMSTTAEGANTVATNTNTGAVKRNATAYRMHPIVLFATIVLGVVMAMTALTSAQEQQTKAARENAKANAEAKQKIAEEVKTEVEENAKLYKEYIELRGTIDNSSKAKENLKENTEELCKALGVEWNTLDKLQGKYEEVNKEIAEAQKESLIEGIEATKESIEETKYYMLRDSSSYSNGKYSIAFDEGAAITDEINIGSKIDEALMNAGIDFFSPFHYDPDNVYGNNFVIEMENADDFLKAYETVKEIIEKIQKDESISNVEREESELYNEFYNWINKYKDDYEKIVQYQKDMNEYAQQLAEVEATLVENGVDFATDSYEEVKEKYIQQLKDTFNELGIGPSVDDAGYDEYFEGLAEQYLSGYSRFAEEITKENLIEDIFDRVRHTDDSLGEMFTQDISQEFKDAVEKIVNDPQYKLKVLASLDWEVLANSEDLESDIDKAYYEAYDEVMAKEYEVKIPILTSAITNISSGKELTEEQLALIKELETEYTNLGTILDKTSLDYINALKEIRENMEDTQSRDAVNDLIDAWGELGVVIRDVNNKAVTNRTNLKDLDETLEFLDDVEVGLDMDSEEFMQQLNDILKADYAVQVKIEADINSDITDIVGRADEITKAAQLIQEGFKVARKDIMSLEAAFPGIFESYSVTADGMIQLNQQIAQSSMDTAAANVQTAKEECKERIKAEITVVDAKIAAVQDIIAGLQVLVSTEKNDAESVAKAKEQIENGVTKLKDACADEQDLISNNLATAEIEDSNQVKTANNNAATNSAMGWARAYKNMVDNSRKWAAAAIKNANSVAEATKAAAEGEVVDPGTTSGEHISGVNASVGSSSSNTSGDYSQTGGGNVELEIDTSTLEATQKSLETAQAKLAALQNSRDSLYAGLALLDAGVGSAFNAIKNAGSGSGGGGKGSGDKDNEGTILDPEDKKDLKDIEDRYHEITREIEYQENLFDELQKDTERAYGIEKIRSYKKEQANLNQQLYDQAQLLKEAQKNYKNDKELLLTLLPDIKFNEKTNEILNHEQILQGINKQYNDFIDTYNEYRADYSKLTKDQQEGQKETLKQWEAQKEAADELFKSQTEALSQYEETLDKIEETTDNMTQIKRDLDDNRLKQIEYRIKVVADVKDMHDAVHELTKTIAESFGDEITHGIEVAKIDKTMMEEEAALYPEYRRRYYELQRELKFADEQADRDQIISDIKDLQDKVIESAEALVEWIETIDDLLPNALADAKERFEDFTSWLDHNKTITDTIKELYALQGMTYKTQQGFEKLQRTSSEKLEALTNKAALNRSWYKNASEQVEEARKQLESLEGNEQDVRWDVYKANYDALLEEQQKAQEEMLSSAKEALETAQEMATLSVERTVYELEQQLTNSLGFELLQDKYDHYIEKEERYFDKVNEAYKVAYWYDKLQTDIDKTTDSAMKKRLKTLQDEINARREGNKLSQYDLDILEAKYKVLQAEVALEEAQNAKNKINLVRDRQGNWNYQFTADPDKVNTTEQDLIKAQNEWYNIAKTQVKDVTAEIISTMQECSNDVQEIWKQMIEGTLTEEEGYAKIAELREYYTEKIKYLEEEKNIAISDMTEAGNESLLDMAIIYGDKVSDITGVTADDIEKIIQDSGTTVKNLLLADNETIKDIVGKNTDLIDLFSNVYAKDLNDMTNTTGDFEDHLDSALQKCEDNWESYTNTLEHGAEITGTSLEDLDGYIEEVSDSNQWLYETGLEASDALWEEADSVRRLSEELAELAVQAMETVDALAQLAAQQAEDVEQATGLGDTGWRYQVNDYSIELLKVFDEVGGGKAGLDRLNDAKFKWLWDERNEKYNTQGWANKGAKNNQDLKDIFNAAAQGQQWALEILKNVREGKAYFGTGGYTGEFENAKLAFLHEKELVLNQTDTKNILSAVKTVRSIGPDLFNSIEKAIEDNAISAMYLLGERMNNINNAEVPPATIEQRVSIEHVEFPNVTEHDEIIQAFEGLTNDAAQWALRRKE